MRASEPKRSSMMMIAWKGANAPDSVFLNWLPKGLVITGGNYWPERLMGAVVGCMPWSVEYVFGKDHLHWEETSLSKAGIRGVVMTAVPFPLASVEEIARLFDIEPILPPTVRDETEVPG